MKKTFMTSMADKSGAFLTAAKLIERRGGNITRANYNKAVDAHMLFLDVEADEDALNVIEEDLTREGYLTAKSAAKVVLLEAEVIERPGAFIPLLEVLNRSHISISYLSAQVDKGAAHQVFRMGLYIEQPEMISTLLEELSRLCPVRILQYDAGEQMLDNTVFYLNFASDIRHLLHLSQEETNEFINNANLVMHQLENRSEPPRKTFEFVNRFARFIADYSGENFQCRVTSQLLSPRVNLTVIEPPCGCTIYVLEDGPGGPLLVIDGGFSCYRRYTLRLLRQLFPDFDTRPREMFLTHSDADHLGIFPEFGVIHCSPETARIFEAEAAHLPGPREENPKTLPYYRLCKVITGFKVPMASQLQVHQPMGGAGDDLLTPLAPLDFGDLHFQVFEGPGGHVPGETLLFDEEHKIAVTGDLYLNVRDCIPAQKSYNTLAPYLMGSVNNDSAAARTLLQFLREKMDGNGWLILPGHGAVVQRTSPM
ncbi:MAG: MBL fold metallo-hydrolase [Clostridiales bacterium]|nr:MBL fold metallo-hydrolase [Clostridiales bacterium]